MYGIVEKYIENICLGKYTDNRLLSRFFEKFAIVFMYNKIICKVYLM